MTPSSQEMILGAFFNPTGHHVAAWRHPQGQPDAGINFAHYREIARTAERGKFQLIFLADNLGVRDASLHTLSRSAQYVANFEPLTLLAALAAVTDRIGLVATASTTYHQPYHLARMFGSLDHISGGRAGWNIVTSTLLSEARNFGLTEQMEHSDRYRRAREFTTIVCRLWDSWDDDAFVRDVASGIFFDPDRLHTVEHHGEFFDVAGPLNVPRPPQGYPVLVQAGASEDGRDFASEFAEIVFSNHLTLDSAVDFRIDLHTRVREHGRTPDQVKVLPGLSPIVGSSRADADEKYAAMQELIEPIVGREMLSTVLGGVDLSDYDLDGQLPRLVRPRNAIQSAFENWTRMAREERLTIRQLGERVAGARGKTVLRGTPSEIADVMQRWFTAGACDGFNVMPAFLPGGLNDFVDLVVPELQNRGLFHHEYCGATLRENLGLHRPGDNAHR